MAPKCRGFRRMEIKPARDPVKFGAQMIRVQMFKGPWEGAGLEDLAKLLGEAAGECDGRAISVVELSSICDRARARLEPLAPEAREGSQLNLEISPGAESPGGGALSAQLAWAGGRWEPRALIKSAWRGEADNPLIQAAPAARLRSAPSLALEAAVAGQEEDRERLLGWVRSGAMRADEPMEDDAREAAASKRGLRAQGASALWLAALSGRGEELARGLIRLGADPNRAGPNGWPPLLALAKSASLRSDTALALALALLEAGADPLGLGLGLGKGAKGAMGAIAKEDRDCPAAQALALAFGAAWERRRIEASLGGRGVSQGAPRRGRSSAL